MQREIALHLDSIAKKYGNITVVDNVSFEVKSEEFFTLLGPSGCGKTTLLRMIAGFTKPDHGRIILDGKDVTETEPHRRAVGMVFQNYALFPHMTVSQNLAFGLKVHGVKDKTTINRQIETYLDLVQLLEHADKYPRQLSGGQQQRVALARCLVLKPKLILLDEPLSNLDLKLRMIMQRELKKIIEVAKTSAIYVTHDQVEALSMSDRIGIMNRGKIVQIGTPIGIYTAPTNEFSATFVGEPNLLHGHAEGFMNGLSLINLDNGTKVQVASDQARSQNELSILIKPEKIKLSTTLPDASVNVFKGVITEVAFRGMHVKYQIQTGSLEFIAIKIFEGEGDLLPIGSEVYALIDPNDIVIVQS